jgi:hypothetical protein
MEYVVPDFESWSFHAIVRIISRVMKLFQALSKTIPQLLCKDVSVVRDFPCYNLVRDW